MAKLQRSKYKIEMDTRIIELRTHCEQLAQLAMVQNQALCATSKLAKERIAALDLILTPNQEGERDTLNKIISDIAPSCMEVQPTVVDKMESKPT